MSDEDSARPWEKPGPLDEFVDSQTISARVVKAGDSPRIFGYSVQSDLARHYSFAESVYLALTGSPPSRVIGRAFETALIFFSPVTIGEAPAHAARVARACKSSGAGVLATAGIALSEDVRTFLEHHQPLLDWLEKPESKFPAQFRAATSSDHRAVRRLQDALGDFDSRVFEEEPVLTAALLGVMYACGVKSEPQLQASIVTAKLAVTIAEGLATRPGRLDDYPANLPEFEYVPE